MAESPESIAKLELLPSPKISIARAGLVHYMLPSVLRFWEKEGLGPRSGAKNVIAFALFEGDDRAPLVASWLERVSRVYNVSSFLKLICFFFQSIIICRQEALVLMFLEKQIILLADWFLCNLKQYGKRCVRTLPKTPELFLTTAS